MINYLDKSRFVDHISAIKQHDVAIVLCFYFKEITGIIAVLCPAKTGSFHRCTE